MTTTIRTPALVSCLATGRRIVEWLRAGQPPCQSHIGLVALAGETTYVDVSCPITRMTD
jgi:hypothetical protein